MQGFAQRGHVPDDSGFFDNRLAPYRRQELILFDDLTVVLEQQQQNVEGARGQRDETPIAPQQAAGGIQQKWTERVSDRRVPNESGFHFIAEVDRVSAWTGSLARCRQRSPGDHDSAAVRDARAISPQAHCALRDAARISESNPTISERFRPSAGTPAVSPGTSTCTDSTRADLRLEQRNVKTGVEELSDRHLDGGGPPCGPRPCGLQPPKSRRERSRAESPTLKARPSPASS